MGLDMYAYAIFRTPAGSVDFEADDGQQIHYWRKHPNLHGWMEQLYRAKGGSDREFNCVNLKLTAADLDRLEDDIRAGNLPAPRASSSGNPTGPKRRTISTSSRRRGTCSASG